VSRQGEKRGKRNAAELTSTGLPASDDSIPVVPEPKRPFAGEKEGKKKRKGPPAWRSGRGGGEVFHRNPSNRPLWGESLRFRGRKKRTAQRKGDKKRKRGTTSFTFLGTVNEKKKSPTRPWVARKKGKTNKTLFHLGEPRD